MTPTRKYWIALTLAACAGAAGMSTALGSRLVLGAVIGASAFVIATRPRY